MDSLTQAALGACVAAACVPGGERRKALLVGAALGTAPDLDVLIDYGDAVRNFTYHRGFSHSLFVLPAVALALWLALRRWWAPVRAAPRRWLLAIMLALVTHPLVDAHTAYGTQIFWPLDLRPASWSTIFIIDPLFTLPLLVGIVAIAGWARRPRAFTVLATCLALSTAYLGWTWIAKGVVEHGARQALAADGRPDAKLFSVPTPFNSLLWRVVVLTPEGHEEGFDSLLVDEGPMAFTAYASDVEALADARHLWAVERLAWFADGFVKADVEGERLIVTDLRMGQEPTFVFRHAVATRGNPHWEPIPTEQVHTTYSSEDVWRTLERILEP